MAMRSIVLTLHLTKSRARTFDVLQLASTIGTLTTCWATNQTCRALEACRHQASVCHRRASLLRGRRERGKLLTAECRTGHAPASLRCLCKENPRTFSLRRVAAGVCDDGRRVFHQLFLTRPA